MRRSRNRNRRRKKGYGFGRVLGQSVLIGLLSWGVTLLTPWWGVSIAAFLIAFLLSDSGFKSFLEGFLGVGLCWLSAAALVDFQTSAILSEKIAVLLTLPNQASLLILTAVVGGLVGGFAGLNGYHLRKLTK